MDHTKHQNSIYNIDTKNIVNSAIGDYASVYNIIIQRYPYLRDFIYDFSYIFDDKKQIFVGRKFIYSAIDEFISQKSNGYLRIIADAGLGKTAISVQLVKRYQAVGLFANNSTGITDPKRCLNHIMASIIAIYELHYDHLPENAGHDANFLITLLGEVQSKRNYKPLVIVIDAIDEIDELPPGHNALHLPDVLPEGVYIIVSHRPATILLTVRNTPIQELQISWNDPLHQRDIQEYIYQWLLQDSIVDKLRRATPEISHQSFVDGWCSLSQGNFMYLTLVMNDIACGEIDPNPYAKISPPQTLTAYYQQFWSKMEHTPLKTGTVLTWKILRQIVGLFAAAREPVTANWIAAIVGVDQSEVHEFVLLPWQRFLVREHFRGRETWRIVHLSFAEFLAAQIDIPTAHHTISAAYAYGGLSFDPYAQRHLSTHLRLAGQQEALFLLIHASKWFDLQFQHDPSGENYRHDIAEAWSEAETINNKSLQEGKSPPLLIYEIRCLLATTSTHNLTLQVPLTLLIPLTSAGLWEAGQALRVALQHPLDSTKEIIEGILPLLNKEDRTTALHALGRADNSQDPTTPDIYTIEQFKALLAHPELLDRAAPIISLLPQLSGDLLTKTRDMALQIANPVLRGEILIALVPYLVGEARVDVLSKALKTIQSEENLYNYPDLLKQLAPYLPHTLLMEVLTSIQAQPFWPTTIKTYLTIHPFLPPVQADTLLEHLVREVENLPLDQLGYSPKALGLEYLIPYLNERQIQQMLLLVPTLDHPRVYQDVLPTLILRLVALGMFDKVSPLLSLIPEQMMRDQATVRVIAALGQQGEHSLALGLVTSIMDDYLKVSALDRIAPFLSEHWLHQAAHIATTFPKRTAASGHDDMASMAALVTDLRSAFENMLFRLEYIDTDLSAFNIYTARLYAFFVLISKASVPYEVIQDICVLALEHDHSWERLTSLALVAPYLTEANQQKLWNDIQMTSDVDIRVKGSIILFQYLPSSIKKAAFISIRHDLKVISNTSLQLSLIVELLPHTKDAENLALQHEALSLAQEIRNTKDRANSLDLVIPVLTDELQTAAIRARLAASWEIADQLEQITVLMTLFSILPVSHPKEQIVEGAINQLGLVGNSYHFILATLKLLPYVPEELKDILVRNAVVVTEGIWDIRHRVEVFIKLFPFLPDNRVYDTPKGGIISRLTRATSKLAKIFPWNSAQKEYILPDITHVFGRVVDDIERLIPHNRWGDSDPLLQSLIELAPYADSELLIVMRELVNTVPESRNGNALKAQLLNKVSDLLAERQQFEEALETVQRLEYGHAAALARLARHATGAYREDLIKQSLFKLIEESDAHYININYYTNEKRRVQIHENLPIDLEHDIRSAINYIDDPIHRANACINLVPYLISEKNGIISDIEMLLDTFYEWSKDETKWEDYSHEVISIIINSSRYLSPKSLNTAYSIVISSSKGYERAQGLIALSNHADSLQRDTILNNAIEAAYASSEETLAEIAPHVPIDVLLNHERMLLAVARYIGYPWYEPMAQHFLANVGNLPNNVQFMIFSEALASAKSVHWERTLTLLLPAIEKLPAVLIYPLWQELLHTFATKKRKDILGNLVFLLPLAVKIEGRECTPEFVQEIITACARWP